MYVKTAKLMKEVSMLLQLINGQNVVQINANLPRSSWLKVIVNNVQFTVELKEMESNVGQMNVIWDKNC